MKDMKLFDLQLFAEDGGNGTDGGTGSGAGNPGGNGGAAGQSSGKVGATYSYEQAEQIAEARADRAAKAALAGYFKQQGMSEDEITAAISDYKAKKAASQPDVESIRKERDEAVAALDAEKNAGYLRERGVKAEDLDYVLFKVGSRTNEKTDFRKAADAFLKENPRFTGRGYRVSTGAQTGGSGAGRTVNEDINAAIRTAARK